MMNVNIAENEDINFYFFENWVFGKSTIYLMMQNGAFSNTIS